MQKHTRRIRARTEARLAIYQFFNASHSGPGIALFLCGLRFVAVFARKDVLALDG